MSDDSRGITWGAVLGLLGVVGTILGIVGFFIDDLPGVLGTEPTLSPEEFFLTVQAMDPGSGDDLGGLGLTQQAIEDGAGVNQATQQAFATQQAELQATLDSLRTQQAVSAPVDDTSSGGAGDDGGETGGETTIDPTPSGLTLTDEDQAAIEDAVITYDAGVRYMLETGDTSQIAEVAAGTALDDRLEAAAILKAAGDCVWQYDHQGLYVDTETVLGVGLVEVRALVDRSGTVFCPSQGVLDQYAFEGPYYHIYVVSFIDDRWIVTDSHAPEDET